MTEQMLDFSRPDAPATPDALLRDVFGLESFRPGQEGVVEAQMRGRDVLSVAPTGSGKSISYWLPALLGEGVTIVVSPLIALMKDQVDRLRGLGVEATFVNSSIDRAEQYARLQAAGRGQVKLLYLAPERLSRPGFVGVLAGLPVRRIVVDEAHCISSWGHDFRPDYRLLGGAIAACGRPPVAAFTATATPQVREDIAASLALRDPFISVTGFNRPNLRLEARRCRNDEEKLAAVREVVKPGQRSLVYCATVATTEDIAGKLRGVGLKAAAYNARLGDVERRRVQDGFSSGELEVVVATVAFGMGVDIADVRQVVHFHLPSSLEGYYQEAGRAGRDGLPANCLLLWRPADRELQAFMIERGFEDAAPGGPDRRDHAYAKLGLMLAYARHRGCRHARIADYFGEEGVPRTCQACDNCLDPRPSGEQAVPVADVRAVLSAIRRFNGRIGAANVAAVLAGTRTKWVREHAWTEETEVFGSLRTWTPERLRELISELIATGLAGQSSGEYPTLVMTPAGDAVVRGVQQAEVLLDAPAASVPRRHREGRGDVAAAGPVFEALRRWRLEKARELEVPPFVVFSDRVLAELSARMPADQVELLAVPGIGPAKAAQFGADVLRLVAEADAAG